MRPVAILLLLVLLGALVPLPAHADHPQPTTDGGTLVFDSGGGNEWWVQVRLGGSARQQVTAVDAMDTNGAWTPLTQRSWTSDRTWWAASFRIEPGHDVRFRASIPGSAPVESCWFTHPGGVETCTTPPPPPPPPGGSASREAEAFATRTSGGRGTSSAASGGAYWNLWSNGHIQDTLDGDGVAALEVVARGTPANGVWPTMVVSVDGSVTATFVVSSSAFRAYAAPPLPPGAHVVRIAFTNDARTSTEDRNLHVDVVRAGGAAPPPPPPPPGSGVYAREAEAFAVKTVGRREDSSTSSGGAHWNLWSNGHIQDTLDGDGQSELVVVARGRPALGEWPTMVVSVDGAVTRTFTVASTAFTAYRAPPLPEGKHTVRIAFTNDKLTSTEDRNLYLDVVRVGDASTGQGPFTIPPGGSVSVPFWWDGGAGHLLASAATLATNNTRPHVLVALDGVTLHEAPVAGPVARPVLASFATTAGWHNATYTAENGTVVLSGVNASHERPPTSFAASTARVRSAGSAEGSGWRLPDYGFVASPLVVETTGWYELRVTGVGTVVDGAGALVHLWLNRTVVAEATAPGTTIDLRATRLLVAGVGYELGAAFENPWPERTARFDHLSATLTGIPPPLRPPAAPLAPLAPTEGWPQYGRDAHNTRHSPDPTLPGPSNASRLTRDWRVAVDGSVTGTPAVVDGRVYVGTWARSVYALDEETGAVVWRRTLPERIDGSLAVGRGFVLVGSGSEVVALNATTGSTVWTRAVQGGHLWASPIIDGDDVFVGVNSGQGYVAKLDLHTGVIVWRANTTGNANGGARIWATPLAPPGSGMVVVGTSPGTATLQPPTMDALLAFDRDDGRLLWTHQFFPRDQNREHTREVEVRENRDISGTPHLALRDGRPIVLASQKHGPAWAVDLADGSLVHGSRLLEPRPALVGSGGVAEGVEVVSSTTPDRVAGFDLATGDLLWEQPLPSTNFAPVALGGGLVWIGSWGTWMHAFDLHTGREVARLDAERGILGGAALANGGIVVGGLETGGHADAFDSIGVLPGAVMRWH